MSARLLGEESGLNEGAGRGAAERIARAAHNEPWLGSTLDDLQLGGPTTERIQADPADRKAVRAAIADRAQLAAILASIAVTSAELSAQLEDAR